MKPSSYATRMAGSTCSRHNRKLSLVNFSVTGMDRDVGTVAKELAMIEVKLE
jgi:hypothetical protein